MERENVTVSQLVAGALLKFGKVDSVDMTLLMGGIYKIASVVNDEGYMTNYFILVDGSVVLNEEYFNRFYHTVDSKVLERFQGSIVRQYLDNLNISEFVLRKIKLLSGFVVKDSLDDSFSDKQMMVINKLYSNGYIEDYIHEDVIYGDYEAVRITQKGKLLLFCKDNREELNSFLSLLRTAKYTDEFINEFLILQDLSKSASEVLSISNFELFCNTYDEEDGYARKRMLNKK